MRLVDQPNFDSYKIVYISVKVHASEEVPV